MAGPQIPKQNWDPIFFCNCFWLDPGPFYRALGSEDLKGLGWAMAGAYGGAGLRGGGHMGLPGPLSGLALKPPEPLRADPFSVSWPTWAPLPKTY